MIDKLANKIKVKKLKKNKKRIAFEWRKKPEDVIKSFKKKNTININKELDKYKI